MAAHIGAAVRHDAKMTDDDGNKLWVIEKERRDSPFKIDYAMAAVISLGRVPGCTGRRLGSGDPHSGVDPRPRESIQLLTSTA